MKKQLLTLLLVAMLALSLCVPAAAFSDVAPGAWYAPAVDYCVANGLMDGMGGDAFVPNGTVTRAQLVTTLWRLAGRPTYVLGGGTFSDVPDGAWYANAVHWAVAAAITNGTGNGRFSPDAQVTREMMATFFYRYAGMPAAAAGAPFTDQNAISDWAQTATNWAAGVGLMQGVGGGMFDPKTLATRAALAQTLMNYGGLNISPILQDNGVNLLSLFCAPTDVIRGADGALYVADTYNKAVWRLIDGRMERIAGADSPHDISDTPVGGYLDGNADQALFASTWAIAPFLNGLAISDPENNVVRVLQEGVVWTANIDGYAYPTGLAADGKGNLYIANTHAGEILLVTPEGKVTKAATGLDNPMGLCYANGTLYIAETGARRVMQLRNGTLSRFAGSGTEGGADGPAMSASFVTPMALTVGTDGSVYVSDPAAATVRCVRNGSVTTVLQQEDPLNLDVFPMYPLGLLAEGTTLYVCDRFLRELSPFTIG